jgi:hypothetical protein
MTDVQVWSEVDPSLRSYTDCTWCSILMAIVGSGFDAFPLGAYTHAERRAFRGTSAILNFSGPVAAAQARYGITVVRPAPYSPEELRAALRIPGRVYAVAGRLANYPAGHPRRRWDPTFAGFHAVAVQTFGNDLGRWLDPLAPMGFAGDSIDIDEVVDVFAVGNYPNDARYLPTEVNMKIIGPYEDLHGTKTTIAVAPVGNLMVEPSFASQPVEQLPQATTVFFPDWGCHGTPPDAARTDRWLYGTAHQPGISILAGYMHESELGPLESLCPPLPEPTPPPAADVDVEGALADLSRLTVALNDIARARTRAVGHKNAARTKLGG